MVKEEPGLLKGRRFVLLTRCTITSVSIHFLSRLELFVAYSFPIIFVISQILVLLYSKFILMSIIG